MINKERIFSKIGSDNQVASLGETTRLMKSVIEVELCPIAISNIIRHYPDITSRIIFLANSAWHSPRAPVENLEKACTRLGARVVRGVAISLSVNGMYNPHRCSLFDRRHFWASSLLIADGAAMLAQLHPDQQKIDDRTSHSAGLLHNIGLLWMAHHFPEETSQCLQKVADEPGLTLHEAQNQILGTNFCEIGARLAEEWNLSVTLVDVIAHHHEPPQHISQLNTQLVSIAAMMVHAVLNGLDFNIEAAVNQLNHSQLEKVFQSMQKQLQPTLELVDELIRR